MSSIDHHPANTLQIIDVADAQPAMPSAAFGSTASAVGHPPFDELLAGLNQLILLGQATRRPVTRHAAFEEDDHERS